MALGNLSGRARTDPSSPRAFAICDQCGILYNRIDLAPLVEYMGPALQHTGFYVCPSCLDKPQSQFRPVILPPSPIPVDQPRPDFLFVHDNLGPWSSFVLFDPSSAGQTEAAILAAGAGASGIPTPQAFNEWFVTTVGNDTAQMLMPANATRSWLAVYNPSSGIVGIDVGTAAIGASTTVLVGPGVMLLYAASPMLTGAVTAAALAPGMPFFSWDH